MNPFLISGEPKFEAKNWSYESVLVAPQAGEHEGAPGTAVTAKKWASGSLAIGPVSLTENGYQLTGSLQFAPGIELAVTAEGKLGGNGGPASFSGTGTGVTGPTKGAVYELTGWLFLAAPTTDGNQVVQAMRGAVRAVRGTDAKPETELGGTPVGTVGIFEIIPARA